VQKGARDNLAVGNFAEVLLSTYLPTYLLTSSRNRAFSFPLPRFEISQDA